MRGIGPILLLAGLTFGGGPLVAQASGTAPEGFTLPNGLRVVVDARATTAAVTVSLWVHAGRAADPAAGGVAHLLEHLLAMETASYGPGEANRRIQEVGGLSRATSDLDRTAYTERVAVEHLQLALDLQADRLRTPPISEGAWNATIAGLRQEQALLAAQPLAPEQTRADSMATRSAAYRAALGWRQRVGELDTLSPDRVRDFHRRWFVPGNSVLVVAGAVDPAEVRPRIEEAFGGLAGNPVSEPPPGVTLDTLPVPPRMVVEDPSAAETVLWIAYAVPPGSDSDREALAVLATLLSGGTSSRLHRRLIDEQRLVRRFVSALNLRRGPGTLVFGAILESDVDPDLAESLILSILEEVAAEGVAPLELERAKRQRRAEILGARLTSAGRAAEIQRAALHGRAEAPSAALEALERVGELDLVRVSARSLNPERRAVIRVQAPSGGGP